MLLFVGIMATGQVISYEDQFARFLLNREFKSARILLKKGLDVNYMFRGNSLLHLSYQMNNAEMIRLLVGRGASVMLENKDGLSPLYLASTSDNPILLDAVLSGGYQHDLRQALLYAIKENKPENVRLLLSRLKDVNFETYDHLNPLIIAAETGHPALMKLLEEHGAGMDFLTVQAFNRLILSNENNLDSVIQYLALKNESLMHNKDSAGNTALHNALQQRNFILTEFFLKKGTDPFQRNGSGESPLEIAMKHDFFEGAGLLLGYKGMTDLPGVKRAFMQSIFTGNLDWVKKFVESGLNPDKPVPGGYEGYSIPVVLASSLGNSEMVDYFISKEVRLNRVDSVSGETALTIACKNQHTAIAVGLINAGCEPNIPDNSGNTPFALALFSRQREIVARLLLDRPLINAHRNLRSVADSLHVDSLQIKLCVDKSRFILSVVAGRDTLKQYDVSLGFNPVDDKNEEGDGCTPEGVFRIAAMYPHDKWCRFLWFDYPNAESWRRFRRNIADGVLSENASIGGQIGIHGVPEGADYLISERINWTAGCIALTNDDIMELYDFVKCGQQLIITK